MFYETILWLTIFIITFIASIAAIIYLGTRFSKFSFMDRLAPNNRILRKLLPAVFLIVFIALAYLIFGYVNAIVIVITLTVFWIISDLIILIINRINNKLLTKNIYYAGILAFILTTINLSIGWYNDHHVVETDYVVVTAKNVEPLRIAQITDSHLGTTFDGEGFAKKLEQIQAANPDILLITGDYVDGSSKYSDIISATKALGEFKTKYGIYFCYGNHDRNFYELNGDYTEEQLNSELIKNNVVILKDQSIDIPGGYTIIGREDASASSRLPISELVTSVNQENFIIDMNHQPNDYALEEASGVDMVLSGHTHGGQLIPITNVGLWIGANDKIYGREKRSNTEFIVSSGISDWALDFKTGCRSEFVIIDVVSE